MVTGLLWIVGIYGTCAGAVYMTYALRGGGNGRSPYLIVCMTQNHAQQIEWYIRTFMIMSVLRGRPVEIHVLDSGSTDETLDIVVKAARRYDGISILPSYEWLEQELAGRDESTYRVYVLNGNGNHRNISVVM